MEKFVIGTDSCRAVVVNCASGKELASYVSDYPRWKEGRYCDPSENRYRQHPQDYIDSLETAQLKLGQGALTVYEPREKNSRVYHALYGKYKKLGDFLQNR